MVCVRSDDFIRRIQKLRTEDVLVYQQQVVGGNPVQWICIHEWCHCIIVSDRKTWELVIAISSNDVFKYPQDSFERMTERANEKHFPFPYLFDESQEIARNFKAEKTPHVFVVTRSGELIFEGAIDDNYKDAAAVQQHYLADALNAFLKGEPPVNAKVNAVGCSIKWKV